MNLLWNNSHTDPISKELSSVLKKLTRLYRVEAKQLTRTTETLPETEAIHSALLGLIQVRTAIDSALQRKEVGNAIRAISLLAAQRERMKKLVEEEKLDRRFRAGAISTAAINILFLAENALGSNGFGHELKPDINQESELSPHSLRVVITSDLIYQMHQALFPAEKMLVASAKRVGDEIRISAIFEVTGNFSSGHVNADPARLARALIAMDVTDTYFALWLHSHPGTGKEWTRPSSTDLAQHQDWLRDYSPSLVSGIMVEDRWIRFWGTALENGKIKVDIVGPGISEEGSCGSIYRLEY